MEIRIRALLIGLAVLFGVGYAMAFPRTAVDPERAAPLLEPHYAAAVDTGTEFQLRPGETLSEIFVRAGLPGAELSGLVLAMREHVDPRRILPNTAVRVMRWVRDGTPRRVQVLLNPDSTVVLERRSMGWFGQVALTPTVVDTVAISGVLETGSSLYQTVVDHPELDLPAREREGLVHRLAHIYGWEVDFIHDIRPGDSFRVVYEREARPDGTSRAARVLVAEIVTQGRVIPAIHFDPDDNGGDYFNAEGASLRLAFLRYPVDFPRITSNFSWQRYHPVLKRNRPHLGTDFGTGYGAPIRTTADGVIALAAWDGGYGNLVKVNHGNGYETRYAHLSRFAKGIRKGVRVRQGQVIGYSGDTGLATAPHLHYELRRFGQPQNPREVRLPSAPPVPEQHMPAFHDLTPQRLALLPALPDAAPAPALAD